MKNNMLEIEIKNGKKLGKIKSISTFDKFAVFFCTNGYFTIPLTKLRKELNK